MQNYFNSEHNSLTNQLTANQRIKEMHVEESPILNIEEIQPEIQTIASPA
jgi:hypothetical protein